MRNLYYISISLQTILNAHMVSLFQEYSNKIDYIDILFWLASIFHPIWST